MRIRFTAIVLLYLIKTISAQTLQIEREYNARHYEFNGIEINLTPEKFTIIKNNVEIYSENINGKKVFKASSEQNYFYVANYQFKDSKNDYLVEVKVFNREGSLVLSRKFVAPFDLPHPLLSINDQGVLALFDPLSFKVRLINQVSENKVELEKDIPFEMERAAFIEMNDDFLFILASQNALDITENQNNVNLYKISLADLKIEKGELDYNTPTLLKISENNIFISGVKFEELKPVGKTIKYDFELNVLAFNDKIIERICSFGDKSYGKYFNTIFGLKEDLSVLFETSLSDNERILDFTADESKVIVVTNKLGQYYLYYFSPDLDIDFKTALNNFGTDIIDDFTISENLIFVHHNSNTIKLKLTEN